MIYKTLLGEEIDMEVEIWKPIVKYGKNIFCNWIVTNIEVSNLGGIRGTKFNNRRFNNRMLHFDKSGHKVLGEIHQIYRLVWEAFNGPIPKKHNIHHRDFNPANDRLDNLECLTVQQHMKIHQNNRSNETIQKMSDVKKGKHPWNYGLHFMSEEQKKAVAKRFTGVEPSNKGKHAYNNGIKVKWFLTEEEAVSEGYVNFGYLARASKSSK